MTHWHRILLAVAACGGVACADTLVLKNGSSVDGTFLGGTARDVRFDDGRSVRNYPVSQVSHIDFEGEAPVAEELPPPPPPRRESRPRLAEEEPVSNEYGAEVPGGTPITVRLIDSVDSRTAQLGQTFEASVDEPVMVNGERLIPRGAEVVLKLVEDRQSGRIGGETALGLALAAIRVNGRMLDFTSEQVQERSGSRAARSGKIIGGGAALGAILGSIAGGGRGAAIGAASGAAVGTGAEVATKGERVRVPSETRLIFRTTYTVRL